MASGICLRTHQLHMLPTACNALLHQSYPVITNITVHEHAIILTVAIIFISILLILKTKNYESKLFLRVDIMYKIKVRLTK